MIRAIILSATAVALVTMWRDSPAPVKDNQTPYCVIDERVAMKHPLTDETVIVWGKSYGPCNQQDIFREI